MAFLGEAFHDPILCPLCFIFPCYFCSYQLRDELNNFILIICFLTILNYLRMEAYLCCSQLPMSEPMQSVEKQAIIKGEKDREGEKEKEREKEREHRKMRYIWRYCYMLHMWPNSLVILSSQQTLMMGVLHIFLYMI